MIRGIARARSGSDDTFFELLRELHTRKRSQAIGLDDLRELLTERVDHDWQRFFDQWVLSADLPSYRFAWQSEPPCADGATRLHLEVRREGVPDEWRDLVPLRVVTPSGAQQERWIEIGEEPALWIETAEEPTEVLFNPDFAVLARMGGRQKTRVPAGAFAVAQAVDADCDP
jgi:hypothetical protein